MKKILITAKHSYIGNAFAEWVNNNPNYKIDFISCRSDEWKNNPFETYDVVFHVAGIAHVNAKVDMKSYYYKVNRDLTIDLAEKAKTEGVKQFIFMSSAIVFGENNKDNNCIVINKDTIPQPMGFYGNSKLQAENAILPFQNDKFNVVILRPPMIYGKGSKGNYLKLSKLARKLPVFPNISNKRSMLHIDNLCELIRLIIENKERGIYYPQNEEYICTSEMVKMIADINGKNLKLTSLLNPFIYAISKKIDVVNKVFGTFIYDKDLSKYKEIYCVNGFKETLNKTEVQDGI